MATEATALPWQFMLPGFAKKWSEVFDNDRIPGHCSFVEELGDLKPASTGVELFFRPYDNDSIDFDTEAIIRFCRGILIRDVKEQTKPSSAWMDDRSYAASRQSSSQEPVSLLTPLPDEHITLSLPEVPPHTLDIGHISTVLHHGNPIFFGNNDNESRSYQIPFPHRYLPESRRYKAPLSAETLYENLRAKRYGHPSLPDSDRRVIANPDSYDIVAVTETAPQHLHEALREAILRYFSLKAALGVRISNPGLTTYRLSFHLPHFVLRKKQCFQGRQTKKLYRTTLGLSFLAETLLRSFEDDDFMIEQAQISVVLVGISETRYTVYCFEDNDFDKDREMGDDDFSEDGFQADQIAGGTFDANKPIWNPREYFLAVLLERVKQVLGEWTQVVQLIEAAFDVFTSGRLLAASGSNDSFIDEDITANSHWTRTMLQLIGKLVRTLHGTNEVWKTFISNNGDIGYFSDLASATSAPETRVKGMLHNIHAAFDEMDTFHKKLQEIRAECERLERALEVRLGIEANRNAELTVMFMYPVTVVCTFFSIPDPFVSLRRNGWTFLGSILLVTVVISLLRHIVRGKLFQQTWWQKLKARAKAALRGDRTNTVRSASGARVLRRRSTHAAVRGQD